MIGSQQEAGVESFSNLWRQLVTKVEGASPVRWLKYHTQYFTEEVNSMYNGHVGVLTFVHRIDCS